MLQNAIQLPAILQMVTCLFYSKFSIESVRNFLKSTISCSESCFFWFFSSTARIVSFTLSRIPSHTKTQFDTLIFIYSAFVYINDYVFLGSLPLLVVFSILLEAFSRLFVLRNRLDSFFDFVVNLNYDFVRVETVLFVFGHVLFEGRQLLLVFLDILLNLFCIQFHFRSIITQSGMDHIVL